MTRFSSAQTRRTAALVLVFGLLANTVVLLPMRLLVVALHEVSHALACVISGGRPVMLAVSFDESGRFLSAGGSPLLVLNSGYLGAIWGSAGLVWAADRPGVGRWLAGGLGLVLGALVLTALPPGQSPLAASLLGLSLLAAACVLSHRRSAVMVRWLGLYGLAVAVFDLLRDVHQGSTDAQTLAQQTPISADGWGAIWIALATLSLWLGARHATRSGPPALPPSRSQPGPPPDVAT